MNKLLWIIMLFLQTTSVLAQNISLKKLGHEDLVGWKQISSLNISNDGNWVAYTQKPEKGDGTLNLWNYDSGKTHIFERGKQAIITEDSRFVIFLISPPEDTLRKLQLEKVKNDSLPPDTLVLFNTRNQRFVKYPNIREIIVPEKWSGLIGYYLNPINEKNRLFEHNAPAAVSEESEQVVAKAKERNAENGFDLVLYNYLSEHTFKIPCVKNVVKAEDSGAILIYSTGDENFEPGIYLYATASDSLLRLYTNGKSFKSLTLDTKGVQAAFLVNSDTTKEEKQSYSLMYWNTILDTSIIIADSVSSFINEGYSISQHKELSFSDNGNRLFFGIAAKPVKLPDSILPADMAEVEIWHYLDPVLYTQQNVRRESELKRSYDVVYNIREQNFIVLADEDLPTFETGLSRNSKYGLLYNEQKYVRVSSWDGYPAARDAFVINLYNGERKSIGNGITGNIQLSPDSRYVYWYSKPDSCWFTWNIEDETLKRLTNNEIHPFYNELHDAPDYPSAYGLAAWGDQDKFVLLYDRYDIWKFSPDKNTEPVNLTKGRVENLVYRYIKLDPDKEYLDKDELLWLYVFNEETKASGYATLNLKTGEIIGLSLDDFSWSRSPIKPRDVGRIVFTKENFQVFPDLYISDMDLSNVQRISNANPQQVNYKWGTIELYEWTSLSGEKLQGLLAKPHDFNPEKQYPMIVNFYERSSNSLHYHRAPFPHRSTINYSFYTSRGYLIFNPDISYTVGYPGESAYNAVVSGTTALINDGFVDPAHIGIQGHSWGGYQIAHIITKTDLFKCAASGAPVVNMLSAYGGIRWETGLSRMFQYERTQSRIGGSIWEYPLRYIENSPLFFMDKVNTPVLIMHNDMDGHVPWYQGIEFFIALRRLEKPAWLLNYKNEPHWPLKLENRIDFNIRLQQFFDYYLMDKPKPSWMESGVPAHLRGVELGY
jgi:dipeptidyl aminopeptidase/acylaminoacyl peptidase